MSYFRSQLDKIIVVMQLALAVLASAVLLLVYSPVEAYSALAGGMISVIANAFFALRLFDDRNGWEPGSVTAAVYRGVLGRIVLTLAMFAIALALLRPLNAAAFFAVFLLVQVSPALFASILKKA